MNVNLFGKLLPAGVRRGALALACSLPLLTYGAGTPVGWGANDASQSQVPPGLTNIVAVAGGASHSLALKGDGTVIGWGFNLSGQATVPSNLTSVAAIAAGSTYSLALKSNGTVVVWGSHPAPPAGLSSVTAIAAGWSHSLALKSDGTVVAWGSQTNVPGGLTNVIAIAAGNDFSLALLANGTVTAWGDNAYGKTTVPASLSTVIAIAAGGDHALALRRNGTVVAWGRNAEKQATVPANLNDAIAIGAGALHSVVLRANPNLNGGILVWGDNTYNQKSHPIAAGFISVAAGGYHSLAIKGDNFPSILVQPYSQNIFITKTATLQVVATGAAPLTYQWRCNGTNINGATASTLTIDNFQPGNEGAYTVVVANSYGSVTSSAAYLTAVEGPPVFTLPLKDQTVVCGDSATFQFNADGSGPFSYQWFYQDAPITNATGTSLTLNNVTPANAGQYSVLVTNKYGSITGSATLTVTIEPPRITSPLTRSATQGTPWSYTIQALHSPTAFSALGLPPGLALDPLTGTISGTPIQSGRFGILLGATNACSATNAWLVLNVASYEPVITSSLNANGTVGATFNYTITATRNPISFAAQDLPPGLVLDPTSGVISGTPVVAGEFDSTISASNPWASGSNILHISIGNGPITNLAIGDVTTNYSSPYLLDFQFSLFDPTDGRPLVVDPSLLSAAGFEDDQLVDTNETAFILESVKPKTLKVFLVLDFTHSIASTTSNGDSDRDGLSDAVETEIDSALTFINQQASTAQIGVYEFHRDDIDPQRVIGLTNKVAAANAVAGIWTNYVNWFSSGSRCWDALYMAITNFPSDKAEQRYVLFVSDGIDDASTRTIDEVVEAAQAANVRIFAIGFGKNGIDTAALQAVTAPTGGTYYTGTTAAELAGEFAQIGKSLTGKYQLRWATTRRGTKEFLPSFQISYQGLTATSPPNPVVNFEGVAYTWIDTNSTPPVTNGPTIIEYDEIGDFEVIDTNDVYSTNYIIAPYKPSVYMGNVLLGKLHLEANPDARPAGVTLYADYIPRYIRQFRLYYRPNWPCSVTPATKPGDIFYGWSMTTTNDSTNGILLVLSSPDPVSPQGLPTSIPTASFGELLRFSFQDAVSPSNAFAVFTVDSSIYALSNSIPGYIGQSFTNTSSGLILNQPTLPFGTPVPWLIAQGFANNWTNAETADPDKDGMLTWQEYRANTSPTNAASKLVIRSADRSDYDGRYHVTFSSALNRLYRVDWTTNLVDWNVVQDNIPGTGADVTVPDTRYLPETKLFYRVLVY